jgi:protein-tyrosine phosphatase
MSRTEELAQIYENIDNYVATYNSILSPIENTRLYVSGFTASSNISLLLEHKINIIINVCEEDHSDSTKTLYKTNQIQYYWYPIARDEEDQPIIEECKLVNTIILQNLDKHILVHCQAGISRSVSAIIFHLMHNGLSYEHSFALIQKNRKIILPNDGFKAQICEFYKRV